MLIYIDMKTPDAVHDAVSGVAAMDSLKKALSRWFSYGESVTLCYDTVAKTLTVEEA